MRLPTPYGPPLQPVFTRYTSGRAGPASRRASGVDVGVPRHERLAEEARERGLRVDDAGLGARQLARVAHEEPEHRLLPGEPRDRRQDAVRVGREEEDRLRVAADMPAP